VKCDVYKNRYLKGELVEKLREIKTLRDMVRKRIIELKKITDSTKSSIGTDYIYVPS
jgi:hypothetical protein